MSHTFTADEIRRAHTARITRLDAAFWSHVDRGGPDACWPWTRSRATGTGYGFFTRSGRVQYAHRHALALSLGRPLGDGLLALHSCDNPPCCNPAHLREGSVRDNSADMVARGRASMARAVLSAVEVADVRRRLAVGATQYELAAAFGVARSTIGSIAQGRTWPGVAA